MLTFILATKRNNAIPAFGFSGAIGLFLAFFAITAQADYQVIDRFVPHTSTVPANSGEQVGLFLREKYSVELAPSKGDGNTMRGRVVLFVHGNSVSSVPDFDLPFKDYSWMGFLADAGFDTFAMDHSGYGYSPRPTMDNPCNMDAANRAILKATVLPTDCTPVYQHTLNNSDSDWDEINSVVDYIRELRGVDKVSLIGWSRGGPRIGGYAARYPEKVDKLIFYAPAYQANEGAQAPATQQTGVPMSLQTQDGLMNDRWRSTLACENQIEEGIQEVVWESIMGFDSYGSAWLPGGVMRVRNASYWGWNEEYAAKIEAPSLILVGEEDFVLPMARDLYPDLTGTNNKVIVTMQCSTHFAVWEATQYKMMQEASLEWLRSSTYQGDSQGMYYVERGD